MNKKTYFIVIIVTATVINIALLFRSVNILLPTEQNPTNEFQQLKAIYHMLYKMIFIQYQSENTTINNISGNIGQNEKTDLQSLLSGAPILVFRYSEHNCNTCVEEALKPLMEFSQKTGVDKILIITSYHNVRTMQIFIQKYAPGIHVFNTNEAINLPIEEWDTPYFFTLNSTLKVQSVFVPVKEIQNYTGDWLNVIYKKYFST